MSDELARRMLRGPRYKYTMYSEGARQESLVDLEKDPGEMVNLAGDPKFADELRRNRELPAKWCKWHGDDFHVVSAAAG